MKKILLLSLFVIFSLISYSQPVTGMWRLVKPLMNQNTDLVITFGNNNIITFSFVDISTLEGRYYNIQYNADRTGHLYFNLNGQQMRIKIIMLNQNAIQITDQIGQNMFLVRVNSSLDPYQINGYPSGNYNNQQRYNTNNSFGSSDSQYMIQEYQRKIEEQRRIIQEHEEMYEKNPTGTALMLLNQDKSLLQTYENALQHWLNK